MRKGKFIKTSIKAYLNENKQLVDKILDKINKQGVRSLTFDERNYLKQHSDDNINVDLENWLLSDDSDTFDYDNNKLLFDEFDEDEDIFYNKRKLIRIINKHLNKTPFTNSSDWGSGYVWNINSNNNYIGTFLYLGDDELVVIKRELVDDEYDDSELLNIYDSKGLYSFLKDIKLNPI